MANDGTRVLQEVVQMTGLPEEYLNREISGLLGTANTSVNELSLEQLRAALLNYLESVNEQIQSEIDSTSRSDSEATLNPN